ncbi:MAG: histidinol-phosphatase [Chitinispirillaceae bacterium]|nr:histidinol-phosphatase [Chitinispirillaceae bacterium]
MIVDYHIHTPYCGHAQGKTIQYIEKAIEAGIDEIGFSDHLGRYYLTHVQRRRYWDWGMDERTILRYCAELAELRALFRGRIAVKIGLEIDYVEGAEELLLPLLDHFAFDFYLGSIHCLPRFGWKHLADYTVYNEEKVVAEYFRCVRAALQSKRFHSLAHIDFIWRYLRWPKSSAPALFEKEIAAAVQTAVESGTCIEINANGYLWSRLNGSEGADPFVMLLNNIRDRQAPVTIGSDAHEPALVGKSFAEIIPVLHRWGIDRCMTFTECKSREAPLG